MANSAGVKLVFVAGGSKWRWGLVGVFVVENVIGLQGQGDPDGIHDQEHTHQALPPPHRPPTKTRSLTPVELTI